MKYTYPNQSNSYLLENKQNNELDPDSRPDPYYNDLRLIELIKSWNHVVFTLLVPSAHLD